MREGFLRERVIYIKKEEHPDVVAQWCFEAVLAFFSLSFRLCEPAAICRCWLLEWYA